MPHPNDDTLTLAGPAKLSPDFMARIAATPWAMLPTALRTVWSRGHETDREAPKLSAVMFNADSWDAYCVKVGEPEAASLDVPRASRIVAVVPVYGVIDKSRVYFADVFADELSALLGTLVANQDIGAIVLDWDSPGGAVYGIPELADQIRSYRSVKPIYSIATGDMASAAYWLGSAAAKTLAAPSARVGSIGVWTAHADFSKALEEVGIDVTLISAGKFKVEGNPFEALGDEARAAIQSEVDAYYDKFAEGAAKNRNRRASTVKSGFGEGRILVAERALDEGMIDGIATLPQLLGAIVPRRRGSKAATARARLAIEEASG